MVRKMLPGEWKEKLEPVIDSLTELNDVLALIHDKEIEVLERCHDSWSSPKTLKLADAIHDVEKAIVRLEGLAKG